MSDVAAVLVSVAVWVGALSAFPVPRWLAIAVVATAFAARRSVLLAIGGFLVAGALAAGATAGLELPRPMSIRADTVLLTDPSDDGSAVSADARIGRRHVEMWARGAAASALRDRAAGDVVSVVGRLRPAASSWLAVRHIGARLDVSSVVAWREGSLASRTANRVRAVLSRGDASLPRDRRALLHGFLLGDDRDIDASTETDFRAAGLTHLLAVSGQNLAFVIALAGPLLRRMSLRGRLGTSLVLIAFFTVLTRAEPSVLRAAAMASISCWAAFAGRPVSRVRVLSLAVAGLVLLDPMLPRSVGFQLSVGASVGLVLFASRIASRVPGPAFVAEALSVTIAAQLGVAPVVLATFGAMPAVAPLANLLAVPAAGPLTAWGFAAGLVAGVAGAPFAAILHVPTDLLVSWVAAVAQRAAALPVGQIDAIELVFAVAVVAVVMRHRRMAGAIAIGALLVVARPARDPLHAVEVARGAQLWRASGTVLVIDGAVDSARLLDGLRVRDVRSVDLVVASQGSRAEASAIADLRSRLVVRTVVAPPGNVVRDAIAIAGPVEATIGELHVTLEVHGGVLDAGI